MFNYFNLEAHTNNIKLIKAWIINPKKLTCSVNTIKKILRGRMPERVNIKCTKEW